MNNKIKLLGIGLVSVLALAVMGAGFAFAQTATPPATPVPGTGYGPGRMMGSYGSSGYGGGMMAGYVVSGTTWAGMDAMHQWVTTSGGMHTFVWNALAEKLGLTRDQLTAAANSGKSVVQVAREKGLNRADLVAALQTAHQQSLAQAVTNGILTQAEADSLAAQMAGRYDWMLDNMGQGGMMSGQTGGMMNGQGAVAGCGPHGSGVSATPGPKP